MIRKLETLLFLVILHLAGFSEGLECGYPGSPAYGYPTPVRSIYREGDVINFICNPGYVLLGSASRVCLASGTWSGKLPICDTDLRLPGFVATAFTLHHYPAANAIDGNNNTCMYVGNRDSPWWRLDMRRDYKVVAVAITVPEEYSKKDFSFHIYILRNEGQTASYEPCASFKGKFSSRRILFSCKNGGITGQYIHIQDERTLFQFFGLCEVEVFTQKESYECGRPEEAAHSVIESVSFGLVQYRCLDGYILERQSRRRCLRNGQWTGLPPICSVLTCPQDSYFFNGDVKFSLMKAGKIVAGTTVAYSCREGQTLKGNDRRVCLPDGTWNSDLPECQITDCGEPGQRDDIEKYRLLNGTSYQSVAEVYCGDIADINSPSSFVVCQSNGTWSAPNAICPQPGQLETALSAEERFPTGGLIAGIAVVCVLLLLPIVILILLIRQRKQEKKAANLSSSTPNTHNDSIVSSSALNGQEKGVDEAVYQNTLCYNDHEEDGRANGIKRAHVNQLENQESAYAKVNVYGKINRDRARNGLDPNDHTYGHINSKAQSPNDNKRTSLSRFGRKRILSRMSEWRQQKPSRNSPSPPSTPQSAIYAQVDYKKKRQSRMMRDSSSSENQAGIPEADYYRAPSVCSSLDIEPVKLRELPPIPREEFISSTKKRLATTRNGPLNCKACDFEVMKTNPIYQGLDDPKRFDG